MAHRTPGISMDERDAPTGHAGVPGDTGQTACFGAGGDLGRPPTPAIRIDGPPYRFCDGITRRRVLEVGACSTLGLSLPLLYSSTADAAGGPVDRPGPSASARRQAPNAGLNVIMLWLWGAPSHVDTWDMKPEQPAEIRGYWKPIPSSAPGVFVCEHLPRFARHMHRITQVRTMFNDAPDHPEGAAISLSGFRFVPGKPEKEGPHIGSVAAKFGEPRSTLPASVVLGRVLWDNGAMVPGQTGGFLGGAYAPFRVEDPRVGIEKFPSLQLPPDVTPDRFGRRDVLRRMVDRFHRVVETRDTRSYDRSQEFALRLLTSPDAKRAFDLTMERPETRERYGDTFFGQSCLAARRLVEAGVRYVQVNWSRHPGAEGLEGWDVHGEFGGFLKDYETKQFPNFDRAASALLDDLSERGLLESTLVIFGVEFGRSPKINKWAGRDHWSNCYTLLFAGGGIEGGRVIGESDEQGGYPASPAYHPRSMLVSLYQALGLDTARTLREAGIVDEDGPIPGLFGNRG